MQYHKSVAHMLKITANTANRCAEASIPPELRREVTESQGRVLGYLYLNRDRDIFQKDVEAAFSITRATASKMLTAMERSGLITRSGVAGDARLKKLTLTEKALTHVKRLHAGMRHFEQVLTRGMPQEEQSLLIRLLQKVERNAEEETLLLQNRKEK